MSTTTKIPFLDLVTPHQKLKEELCCVFKTVLETAEFVGGGAAIGGIVGAIFGGGKGAAIGAGIGSGGGAATQALTKGNIRVEPETILTFKLDMALRVVQRRRD